MSGGLELSIRPDWDEIDRVRDDIARFLGGRGLDTDCVDAVTMVACELAENAVKYGVYAPEGRVVVRVKPRPRMLLVEVINPIGDSDHRGLAHMDEVIQWIRGHQDPFEAYLERLEEVRNLDLYSEESGLGLVRIAYEGQAILDFYVDDQNYVAVSAAYPLRGAQEDLP